MCTNLAIERGPHIAGKMMENDGKWRIAIPYWLTMVLEFQHTYIETPFL